MTAGGILACFNPSAFSWFVKRGPASYSLSLGLIMLAMGLTLELKDLIALFMQRPLSVSTFPSSSSFLFHAECFLVSCFKVNLSVGFLK